MSNSKQYRWEQWRNQIEPHVLPSLRNVKGLNATAATCVLWACWFYARGGDCVFNLSVKQVADATNLNDRVAQRILRKLERGGVIKTLKVGGGRGPSERYITGQPYQELEGEADNANT